MNMTGGTADCHTCMAIEQKRHRDAGNFALSLHRDFIVCGNCGSKRCARTDFHENKCDRAAP